MRIVGAVWKRKSSGDRDDSLFEARSPDVPSFSGIPQDVHVCPTPVEGSASCRHRASERSAEIVRRRAEPDVVIPVRDVGDEIRMDDLEGEAEKGSWRKLS